MQAITLVVHGGAGTLRPEVAEACSVGIEQALTAGWVVLEAGGSSKDACEQAIVALEDDPSFNAGVGAHLNREGRAQLDAILMDGASLKSGAVGAVERIHNPIRLARDVLESSEYSFLVGAGAEQYALEHGIPFCDPADLVTPYEKQRWATKSEAASHGTVGAVALDMEGNLCAGTSTGGTSFKYPGRVGDSPLVGCGCYADNESAAVSCTGHGESIIKVVMAKTAADLVAAGHQAQAAADAAVQLLSRRTAGLGGLILVDRTGRYGASFSTSHMTWSARTKLLK